MNTFDPASFGLTRVGQLVPRGTRETPGHKFSIGVECLDRDMWNLDATLPHIAKLGAKMARVQTGWARCERVKGQIDFTWLDAIVDKLLAVGVQPWLSVCYGNKLYIPEASHESAPGFVPFFTDDAREGWKRFCAAVGRHYRDRVKFYEIWNEPDLKVWWGPKLPDGRDYAEFFKMSARQIRDNNPDARLIGGSIAMMLSHKGMSFMERAFEAGIGREMDAFTYHIYRRQIEGNYEKQVQAMRSIIARHAPGIPIWQGESGCPSGFQTEQALSYLPWTPQTQAKWLCRRTMLDMALEVPMTSWFHVSDFDHYIYQGKHSEKQFYYGLVTSKPDHKPKPSYLAYQTFCTLFGGDAKPFPSLNPLLEPLPPATPPAPNTPPPPGVIPPAPTVATPEPLKIYSFLAEGRHLVAYWNATETFAEPNPLKLNLHVWDNGNHLAKPVIIDPLTQGVYRPSKVNRLDDYTVQLEGVPVTDYPLIVAPEDKIPLR